MRPIAKLVHSIILAFSVFITGTQISYGDEHDDVFIGSHRLSIPKRYIIMEYSNSFWNKLLDNSNEILLSIPSSVVKSQIQEYVDRNDGYIDDINVRISLISNEEIYFYKSGNRFSSFFLDNGRTMLFSRDSFGYYKAYRAKNPDEWTIFSVDPRITKKNDNVFSFWVADCSRNITTKTSSGSIEQCSSYTLLNDLAINFSFNADNVNLVPRLRKLFEKLISEWMD